MKDLNLPEPITAYFNADANDGRAVARCFNPDGSVRDEGKTHTGPAAIEAWKAHTADRYRYTATPIKVEKKERTYFVTSHVVGDFPGSPINLRYAFTLERGKIATLEISA